MEKINYEKLGFKAGLEVHQQLDTHKLFCKCPSTTNKQEKPDFIIKRRLRASAGEEGKIDVAALYEMQKGKEFVYEAYDDCDCLVELDCEPPHNVNEEALDTALITAQMLNAKLINEVQIMRKVVIDGSNVSGFQRTMLIATDGYIETSKGRVRIPTICLEEEAAKKITEDEKSVTYRLDRLGVPLLEIATAADIKDSEHAKEVAGIIGMVLRSTNRVKRGLGTIRQDINVSIKNGARAELKGFQELRTIPKVIDNEIKRQLNLIEKGEKLKEEVRKVEENFNTSFLRPMPGKERMYPETDVKPMKITEARIKMLKIPELIAVRAEGFEEKYKISIIQAREIVKENIPFDYFAEKFKIEPKLIANILIEMPKEIKARYNLKVKANKKELEEIFKNLEDNAINKEAVFDILVDIAKGKEVNIKKYEKMDVSDLENEIKIIVEENKGASLNAIMGEVMKRYRGRVSGEEIAKIVKKLVK